MRSRRAHPMLFGRGALCFVFLAALIARGQISTDLMDGTTPPGIAPGASAGSYAPSLVENVNLFSGGLSLAIPLYGVKGRGEVGYTIMLPIETRWIIDRQDSGGGNVILYPQAAGVRTSFVGYASGYLEKRVRRFEEFCGNSPYTRSTRTLLHLIAPDGQDLQLQSVQHQGGRVDTGLTCVNGQTMGTYTAPNRGTEFVSTDASTITFQAEVAVIDEDAGPPLTGYLRFKDGSYWKVEGARITRMADRNGNLLVLSGDGDLYNRVTSITDSLGRTTTIEYSNNPAHPGEDHIKYKGYAGSNRVVIVRYRNFSTPPPSPSILFGGATMKKVKDLFPQSSQENGANDYYHDPSLVAEVEFPDGSKYTFLYNEYGETRRVNLPRGGAYEYDWASFSNQDTVGGQYGELMIYRRVEKRRQYDRGGALLSTTAYDAPLITVPGDLTVTAWEKDAPGTPLRKRVHTFHGNPLSSAAATEVGDGDGHWNEGREQRTETAEGSGTVLATVQHTWKNRGLNNESIIPPGSGIVPPSDPRVTETVTTRGGASTRETFAYSLDPFNNRTEACVYDGGSGFTAVASRPTPS